MGFVGKIPGGLTNPFFTNPINTIATVTGAPTLEKMTEKQLDLVGVKGDFGEFVADPTSLLTDPPVAATFTSPPAETTSSSALLAPEELPAHRKSSLLTG